MTNCLKSFINSILIDKIRNIKVINFEDFYV